MKARISLGIASALIALTISVVGFAGTPGAVATQGQAIQAGQVNTETNETVVQDTNASVACYQAADSGLKGCGVVGLEGIGTLYGVNARGGPYGVVANGGAYGIYASSATGTGVFGDTEAEGQNGVYGHAINSTGSGVYGQNDGTGYGVAGRTMNTIGGTGVLGDAPRSPNGVGVEAVSATGTALKVKGKAQFSRSGVATVPGTSTAPRIAVRVTLPITAKSMMTATLQKYVAGVFVVAAVPYVAGGYFTIYLNKYVTTTVGPIAWMVVERP